MSPFNLSRFKDAALESLILAFLRPKVERYGEIVEFTLDTAAKTVSGLVHFHGEPAPLRISRASYRIETLANECALVIHGIQVDRPWVQNVIADHFPEIKIKLPPAIHSLAQRL
jgi:hypothetical protein